MRGFQFSRLWEESQERIRWSSNSLRCAYYSGCGKPFANNGIVSVRMQTKRCRKMTFQRPEIYVDNVPAWVCVRCGEQYFAAPVYKRLEEIARHRDRIEKTVCFPLAEYDMVLS
ncbi:MAG: YgiT-type zinc finger protein [Nitrospinota bacterium]|nr:MAG: YgiT-type zinc finger protein [Nitrospinota bacterium]